ncbi:MAG: hypothetical protein WD652_01345 [Acidimicrobiia bacterium]
MPDPSIRRVALVFAAMAVVAACSESSSQGSTPIRDEGREVFFELPSGWTVVPESQVAALGRTPFVAQTTFTLPVVSQVVFHGPGFAFGDAAQDTAAFGSPVGSAVVRTIPEGSRDFISRYLLAELVVPYHSKPIATEHFKQDIELADGYAGVQLLISYAETEEQVPAAVLFTVVTDPDDERMYSIAVGCSAECFNTHGEAIAAIIDSWLVNTR